MKKRTGLAAVVAAVVILAMSGWVVAAEPEKSVLPKVWDRGYHKASETGNLNRDANSVKKESISGDQTPKVEIGGRIHRVGIDTP
ncbi:MAG: hypothetical protein A2Z13_01430 [Deltaproteobacteria bacterium RBG_16_64_85]|nr:MAG: hypothetical protein A2Z13_01430 [Deltaproteobacteria bacterium RBG_16_64_85]